MPAVQVWTGFRFDYEVAVSNITHITLSEANVDQSASLASQLAAIPDGTSIEDVQIARLPAGNYRLDETVDIAARNWYQVEGPATGVFNSYAVTAGGTDRAHWQISGGANVELRGIDIHGTCNIDDGDFAGYGAYAEAFFGQHGVAVIGGAQHVLVENVNITNNYGDFLYCGGIGTQSVDVTFRNIVGRHGGRQAIGITNVDGLLCEDIDLRYNGRSGMDIEPNHDSHFVDNVVMRRCIISSKFYRYIVGGSAGDELFHVGSVLMEDCQGIGGTYGQTAILANARKHSLIVRRHIDLINRSTQAITVGLTDETVIIEDCVITSGPSTPTSYGVVLNDCAADVELRRNNFSGVGGATTGADELYGVNVTGLPDAVPASVTHCGNVWAGNTLNDGAC